MLKAQHKFDGIFYISWKEFNKIKEIYNKDKKSFICPCCNKEVIFVDGRKVIKHFRHIIESNCESEPETAIHLEMKQFIQQKFVLSNEELEYAGLLKQGCKPDAFIKKEGIAIEVQHSIITEEEFLRRTKGYTLLDIPVLWIFDKSIIKKTNVPAMIRKAHELYFGRVYVYDSTKKKIIPIHLERIDRYVEEYEGYGGYWTQYKKQRRLNEGDIITSFFLYKQRNIWKGNNYAVAKFGDKVFWEKKKFEPNKPAPDYVFNSPNRCDCGNWKGEDFDECYECSHGEAVVDWY